MKLPEREHYRYQPSYCEENIWHLCQQPEFQHSDVIVMASKGRFFPIRCQRKANTPTEPLLWDYHVVLLWHVAPDARYILDFDTTLAFCTPIADYFRQAFLDESLLKPRFVPLFRVMPSKEYAEKLLSDRRHMRDEYGWLVEPPPWPPTSITESNLHKFTDMSDADYGRILTATQVLMHKGKLMQ